MFNFTKTQTETDLQRAQAKLNLKITDFKKQNTVSVGSLIALIDRLPAYHLTQLQEITYDPKHLTLDGLNESQERAVAEAKGIYLQHKRLIAVFDTRDPGIFRHTLYHEIGHHVYFVVMGHALKHAWVTAVSRQEGFVTDYARINAAEDFAESYVNYLLRPDVLMAIPAKFHFMDEYVFKGKDAPPKPEQLDILA